jgi:DNA-binding NtrC family response regulator
MKEAPVPTVLIVDDERNLRELYETELSEEGYEVMLASNGKEAMDILQERTPDVVVMDIRMPEMDGIEALGKMVSRHKSIPIIINTAYTSYQEDYRTWAAEAYVVKSSDLSRLKDALRKVLASNSRVQ